MAPSSNQVEMVRAEEKAGHQHMVLADPGPISRRIEKRQIASQGEMTFTFEHNSVTDVMFVDVHPVEQGDTVHVIEVGESMGFPGQIQVRVDLEKEKFYGVVIQNFSGFKRKLQWQYRIFSVQRVLRILVLTLLAGLRIEQNAGHNPIVCR